MDCYIPPPIERPHYYAPPTAHRSSEFAPHIPSSRTPSFSHYSVPPSRTSPTTSTSATPSTFVSEYSYRAPLTALPNPHYVSPAAYRNDHSMFQEWTSSRSYIFSSGYYSNSNSDPYVTHSTHQELDTASSLSFYSYQSKGPDQYGHPQVTSEARTNHPQNPPAKVGFGSQIQVSCPEQKEPKHIITTDHYCQICKASCQSAKDMEAHIQGKKHKRNMRKYRRNMIGAQPQGAIKKMMKLPWGPASREKLEGQKKRIYDSGIPVEKIMVCGVCNVVVTSQKALDSHCAGSFHTRMLKRLQKGCLIVY